MIQAILQFFSNLQHNPCIQYVYKGVVVLAGGLILTSYADAYHASKKDKEP